MKLARNFFAFIAMAIVLYTTAGTALLAVQPGEYQVKAAYLYNFAKFAEWPVNTTNRTAPLSICVLGQDPFGPSLDAALAGEIRGRQVVARRIAKMQDGQDCSMVFISASEERRLADVLKTLERNAVLTVSDVSGFSRRGGMIQFVFEGNKIRFEVNLAAAQNAGIQLSSELLKIATSRSQVMNRRRSSSISSRLTWMNMIVSGVALLLAGTAFLVYDLVSFRETLVRNLAVQAEIIGTNSVAALDFDDKKSAEATMAALSASPQILSAAIYSSDGKPFAEYSRQPGITLETVPQIPQGQSDAHVFQSDRVIIGKPIVFQGKTVGFAYIQSDLSEVNGRLKRYAGTVAAILAVSLLAALAISSISKRAISRPATELAEVARVVSREKNYSLRATPLQGNTELAELIDAFNEMLAQIQRRDAELEKGRAELEHRVEERTAELASVNKELEAFSYSVSHDLRAPIRHIDGFSMLLSQKYGSKLEPNALQYLNRIRDSAKHMGQLIDDLLGMARIGRQEAVRRRIDMNGLVEETIRGLQPECEGRRIEWRKGSLPELNCDPNLMKIVLVNLLSNAVKYTRTREQAVIETGCFAKDTQTVFFVRDNGAGFEQEYAHKLFGVFQRLHRAEDFEGTGVGLATVQRIIQKHGGHIWGEGKVDEGATFFFTLGEA